MRSSIEESFANSLLIRTVPVRLPTGERTWTVIDGSHLPIEDVESFLQTRRSFGASPNTVKSYASHVSLLLRWCEFRGMEIRNLAFPQFCHFVEELTLGLIPPANTEGGRPRKPASVKAILSAVESYFEYLRLEGKALEDLRIYKNSPFRGRGGPGAFLEHVQRRRWAERRLPLPRVPRTEPQVIDGEDAFNVILASCTSQRDRLLLAVMYDGGLRIGQALGLRHEDLDPMRNRITIVRRTDNVNRVFSKQPSTFAVKVRRRVFDLYRAYLVDELASLEIESDYVFVNLSRGRIGRPMTDSNARQIVKTAAARVGIDLNPHTLRHSHGTLLARTGWSNAQIAKRLGHSHASSADVYIHLADSDVDAKFEETHLQIWGE
jgi:integrase/recombinase XerD